MTTTRKPPARLYGLPDAEELHATIEALWERDIEPFIDGPGSRMFCEFTVQPTRNHLPSVSILLDWLGEWPHEYAEVVEGWTMDTDAPHVRRAADLLLDVCASTVRFWMADEEVGTHVLSWDADGTVTLDGEPMHCPRECSTCHGTGRHVYSDTGMGMGVGGQMMTEGPCPGTRRRPDLTDCPVVLAEQRQCPDGARCWHGCGESTCWRQASGYGALTPDGTWP